MNAGLVFVLVWLGTEHVSSSTLIDLRADDCLDKLVDLAFMLEPGVELHIVHMVGSATVGAWKAILTTELRASARGWVHERQLECVARRAA